MSQTWNLPLSGGTDTLSVSDNKISDGFDTLRTHWIGASDPSSLVDGMIWAQTTAGKLRMRAAGTTYDIGDWGVSNLGHVRKDGTIAFTGNIDAGSNRIINLAAASGANDGIRKTEFDAKYHATTGHSHNGTTGNGPKLAASNITGLPEFKFFDWSSQPLIFNYVGSDIAWTTYDLTSDVAPDVSAAVYLQVFANITLDSSASGSVVAPSAKFRTTGVGGAQARSERYFATTATISGCDLVFRYYDYIIVPVDGSEQFDYSLDTTVGGGSSAITTLSCIAIGYLTKAS